MKKMKKLFFSVFALSALILSACSGSEKTDTSSTPSSSSSQTPTTSVTPSESSGPEESSVPEESSIPEESSSAEEESSSQEESSSAEEESSSQEESSSSGQIEFKADYRIEIGNAVYDLLLNEGQTEHDKEYYLGADVSKTVAAGEAISFQKLQNDEYQAFTVAPSPDYVEGLTYNNVILDGTAYEIRASGNVEVYLKLDGTEWSYWITGGGEMPDPFYTGYRLAYGADELATTWQYDNALVGVKAESTEQHVLKQLKFTLEVTEQVGAKVWNGTDTGWYGEKYAQVEYQTEEEDGNLILPPGKYEIYFKLMDEGDPQIWVAKYGPASFTSLYYQVNDGQITAFEHRTEPTSLENQFLIKDIALKVGDELGVYFDQAGTQSALPVFLSDDMMTAICLSGKSSNPLAVGVTIDGTYNFYFNEGIGPSMSSEEPTNILKVYTVRAEGTPKTNIQLTVPADLPQLEGKKIYLAGDWAVNWDDLIELTPNESRTVWSGQFTFTKLTQSYKYIIWDGGEGEKDWDFLNSSNRQQLAMLATEGIKDTFEPTPTETVYKMLGLGGVWDYKTNETIFKVDEDDMPSGVLHQWSIEVDLAKDDQFKISDGDKLWYGYDSMDKSSPVFANFTKNEEEGSEDNVIVNVAGTYIIYLKQYETYTNYYVVLKGSEPTPTPTETVYKVLGAGGDWTYSTNTAAFAVDETSLPEGVLHQWSIQLELAKDTEFKINDGDKLWLGYDTYFEDGGAKANFKKHEASGEGYDNVIVDVAGEYKIYLKQYNEGFKYFIAEVAQDPTTALHFWKSDGATYTLTPAADNKSVQIDYTDVAANSYFCIGTSDVLNDIIDNISEKTSFDVTLENKGENSVKFRVDVKGTTKVPESGDESNACINTSAAAEGHTDIYTDLTYGGSTITLAAGEKVVFTIYFDQGTAKGPLNQVAFYFDSCTYGDTSKHSSSVVISNFTFGTKVAPTPASNRTVKVSLGEFAKEGQQLKVHVWGGTLGGGDFDLANDADSFEIEDAEDVTFLIVRLSPGETDYGDNWANVEAQTTNYRAIDNKDGVLTFVSNNYFEWRVSSAKQTKSVTYEIQWERPDWLVAQNGGVFIAGTFSNWEADESDIDPYKLTYNTESQVWSITLENIPLGELVEYKFVIFGTNADPKFWEDWTTLNNPDEKNPYGVNYQAFYLS